LFLTALDLSAVGIIVAPLPRQLQLVYHISRCRRISSRFTARHFSCYRSSCRFIVALLCYRHRISRNSRLLHLFAPHRPPSPNPPNEDYKRSTLSTDPHHLVFFHSGPTSISRLPRLHLSAVSTCAITRLRLLPARLLGSDYPETPLDFLPRGSSGEEILNKQIRSNITKQTPPSIRPLWAVSRSAGSFQNLLVVRVSSTDPSNRQNQQSALPTPFCSSSTL
jgi:hypothetical protein